MPDDCHKRLKVFAAEQGVPMASVVRTALERFFDDPDPIQSTADARTKTWHVRAWLFLNNGLENGPASYVIQSTAELPALAAAFIGDAGVEAMVRADLPRLRQCLARLKSHSARYAGPDGFMLQLDVHRENPDPEDDGYVVPASLRVP